MPAIDPIQTINREVVKPDEVSVSLNELGLHPLGYALPLGVPFRKSRHPTRNTLKTRILRMPKTTRGQRYSFHKLP